MPGRKHANRPGTERRYVLLQVVPIVRHLFHFGNGGVVGRRLRLYLFQKRRVEYRGERLLR